MPISNISMLLYYLDSQIVSALAGAFSCIYSPFQALSNTSYRSGVQPRLVAPDLAYHLRISLGIQWPAHVAHLPQPLKVGAQTKISRISKMDWSCVIPIRMCCMISTVCRYWCLPSSLWLQTIALVEIHLRCLWWSNICNLLLCRNFLCCYVSSVIAFPLVQKSYNYCTCCQFEKLCKFPKLSYVILCIVFTSLPVFSKYSIFIRCAVSNKVQSNQVDTEVWI